MTREQIEAIRDELLNATYPLTPNGENMLALARTALEQMARADKAEADYARLAACSVRELSESGRKRGEAEAEVERLEAVQERLCVALREIARETYTDNIGDRWPTRGATIARAAIGDKGGRK